jgi:hypothetical protein
MEFPENTFFAAAAAVVFFLVLFTDILLLTTVSLSFSFISVISVRADQLFWGPRHEKGVFFVQLYGTRK